MGQGEYFVRIFILKYYWSWWWWSGTPWWRTVTLLEDGSQDLIQWARNIRTWSQELSLHLPAGEWLHLLRLHPIGEQSKFFILNIISHPRHGQLCCCCRKPSKSSSPQKRNPTTDNNHTTKIDPKLGAPRKTAGVRNLPKIEKGGTKKKERSRKESGRSAGSGAGDSDTSSHSGDLEMSSGTGGEGSRRRSANSSVKDLDTVEEETVDN